MGSCLSMGKGVSNSRPPPPPSPYVNNYYRSSSGNDRISSYYSDSSSSLDIEMRLHRVPGRIFLNGSSNFGSLFAKQGSKGINQDAMLLWEKFCSMDDTFFCAVFDGHGPFGHIVAKKVRDSFPLKLIEEWNLHQHHRRRRLRHNNSFKSSDKYCKNKNLQDVSEILNFSTVMRKSFVNACKVMDRELKHHHHHIDCYCSGTTAVILTKQGEDLVLANVGDSRAILGSRDQHGSIIAFQLTTDFKPNLPREAERIRLCKGRVFSLENEPGVARVWLPNVDAPGLAMSRAFGDFCLKDYGVISVPQVSHHRLNDKDEFVVLASDGIWDVLTNQQVVEIVASSPRSSAARELVESAVQAWKTKLPTSKPDDCSAVCLFFHSSQTIPNFMS